MCKILILDNDTAYCSTLGEALRQPRPEIRLDVQTASCREDAVHLARRSLQEGKPIRIFLIDDRLNSEVDGIAVWEELHKILPDAEGVIFSAVIDPERQSRAYSVGVANCLNKPMQIPELITVLARLQRWQQQQLDKGCLEIINEIHQETEKCQSFQEAAEKSSLGRSGWALNGRACTGLRSRKRIPRLR